VPQGLLPEGRGPQGRASGHHWAADYASGRGQKAGRHHPPQDVALPGSQASSGNQARGCAPQRLAEPGSRGERLKAACRSEAWMQHRNAKRRRFCILGAPMTIECSQGSGTSGPHCGVCTPGTRGSCAARAASRRCRRRLQRNAPRAARPPGPRAPRLGRTGAKREPRRSSAGSAREGCRP